MSYFAHAPRFDRRDVGGTVVWHAACGCGWVETQGRGYTTLALARAAHNAHLVARGFTAWTY